jgi:hypothetical protein
MRPEPSSQNWVADVDPKFFERQSLAKRNDETSLNFQMTKIEAHLAIWLLFIPSSLDVRHAVVCLKMISRDSSPSLGMTRTRYRALSSANFIATRDAQSPIENRQSKIN